MPLYELDGHRVAVPASGRFWLAETAVLIGRVVVGEDASVWFGAVVRGDNEPVVIGSRANVQDGCILHADPGFPLTIEPDATVGHGVILHGCTVGRGALVGMGAIVLNGARIGEECLIGAGALVPEGKQIPPRSVVLGSPGKIVREVNERDLEMMRSATQSYVDRWQAYVRGLKSQ